MLRTCKLSITTMILFFLITSVALGDERYSPIRDKTVLQECGGCHMAFQSKMLPKRSWAKILNGLSDHFGEDATLESDTKNHIQTYLQNNAADAGWWGGKFMRGIKEHMTPLRITETPHWVREHNEEVPQWAWSDPKVASKANCVACHPRANRGDYDDD